MATEVNDLVHEYSPGINIPVIYHTIVKKQQKQFHNSLIFALVHTNLYAKSWPLQSTNSISRIFLYKNIKYSNVLLSRTHV